jgi:hypothetical protein
MPPVVFMRETALIEGVLVLCEVRLARPAKGGGSRNHSCMPEDGRRALRAVES